MWVSRAKIRAVIGSWRLLLIVPMCSLAACGGAPMGPTPVPSPSSTPVPGGVVAGTYVLQIDPAPGCLVPAGPHRVGVLASATGTSAQPGVRVLPAGGGSALELEFLYLDNLLRGGLGTTEQGILTADGLRLYMRTIGTGAVTHVGSGRGQVLSGTMFGDLAFSRPSDDELTSLGVCTSTGHRWRLTIEG